jgi:TRAP-type uncharacterized transport system substrate-binding protein
MAMKIQALSLAVALLATTAAIAPSAAEKIHTGAETGVYHSKLCPLLQAQLSKSQLTYACTPASGSSETLTRITADPRHIGYSQLDVLALEIEKGGGQDPAKNRFVVARADDTRECLFLATRNKQFSAYGDIQAYAHALRFILPPKESGTAATFAFLQKIDADGLGKAKSVTFAASADDAVRQALSAEDTLALFVQVPDPTTTIFKTVDEGGGQLIPVIDRTILRQQIGGQKVYFAEETEVSHARWVKSGKTVVTACTPVAVVTGDPARVDGDKARQEHKDVIATIQKMKAEDLLPQQNMLQRMLKRTKELSALSTEKLMDMSEKARVAAGPAMEKAKEATEKAYEKAKEATKDAMDKAQERAKELGKGAMGKDIDGKGGGSEPPVTPAPATPPKS